MGLKWFISDEMLSLLSVLWALRWLSSSSLSRAVLRTTGEKAPAGLLFPLLLEGEGGSPGLTMAANTRSAM